eukprot:2917846-Amphidinium_carterae.2
MRRSVTFFVTRSPGRLDASHWSLYGVLDLLGDSGEYGRMDVSTPDKNPELTSPATEAKWIDAQTVSVPEQSAIVDLRSVLPPELFALLSVPGMLDRLCSDEEKEALSLPALFMRVRGWDELAVHLVRTGLCCVGENQWSPTCGDRHLRAGVFGVEKPDTRKMRMIIDRRRKNAIEVCMRSVLYGRCGSAMAESRSLELKRHMTLPHALQFGDLLLPTHCVFDMSLMDCKDFFYLFVFLRLPCGAPPLDDQFPLQAPAMGDLKSVEIAQAAHTTVLRRAGVRVDEWMSRAKLPGTHAGFLAGVLCGRLLPRCSGAGSKAPTGCKAS